MKLFCPHCGQAVRQPVDLRTGTARCGRCGAFDFGRRLPRRRGVRVAGPPNRASALPRPPKMKIEELGPVWRARWRWYDPAYNFMALWSLLWNGILLFVAVGIVAKGNFHGLWGLSLHGPIGLLVGYWTLAGFVNATTLELAPHGLTIRHGPLPWAGSRRLLAVRIDQLYCRRSGARERGSSRYDLHAALSDGETVRLVGGFDNPDEPRFLEQQLESRLGIQPQPVPGEWRD